MAAAPTRLIVEQQGDIACVSFVDQNILEENAIHQIGDELGDLIDSTPNPKLLLNFRNVVHLSSAALGMLITVNNRIRQRGGQLRLSDIDEQIYEVFVITKLNKLFQIHDQTQAAVDSFN